MRTYNPAIKDTNTIANRKTICKTACADREASHVGNTVCNMCGRPMDSFDHLQGFTYIRRLGYGSAYDGETVTLRLCSSCIDNLLSGCEISPFVGDSGFVA